MKDGEIQYQSKPCATGTQKSLNMSGEKNKCEDDKNPGKFPKEILDKKSATMCTGELKVTRGGEYLISTESADGSKLSIDGDVVVENMGEHGKRRRERLHYLQ